jgi:pimeloyl-ACP methyl ester carboxylesterase
MRRSEFNALVAASLTAGSLAACGVPGSVSTSGPPPLGAAPSFEQAVSEIKTLIARDNADASLEKQGLPRLYEHGGQVANAVVLFHGFTNCPQQFDELARGFFARGCNVYVPLIPRHGKKNRLTLDLSDLTVAELQACAQESYQYGRGLGKRVTALGLSLGGSMAMWLAQTQPVDLAVPIAPFLMPIGFPRAVGMPVMNVLYAWPDQYWWWDPRVKQNSLPLYAYPGFPTHALAQITFLGDVIFDLAAKAKPLSANCTLVTNKNESAVNNNVTRGLLGTWSDRGAATHEVVLTDLGPPRHDIIDPTTFPEARTLVYPKLEAIVLGS